MARSRPVSWGPLIGAMAVGAAAAGVIGWRLNVQSIEHAMEEKRAALKKLAFSKGLPPNQEVMDYLNARQIAQAAESLPLREQLKLTEMLERKTISARWKRILKDIDSRLKKFPISQQDVLNEIQSTRKNKRA